MNNVSIFILSLFCVFAAIGIISVVHFAVWGNDWMRKRRMMNLVKIGSRYKCIRFAYTTAKVINIQKSISGAIYVVYDEGIDDKTDVSVLRIETFLDEYLCIDDKSNDNE